MKYNLRIVCMPLVLLVLCNNNEAAQETTVTNKQVEAASNKETDQSPGNGITGYWKLTLEAYDDNGNKILDEAERKKGIKNRYSLRLNTDGSCKIQEVFKGRYEVKTEGDKKMLYVYRDRVVGEEEQDPPPDIYRIISASKNELVLLENEGNLTFWVFEKAN
jgi:hypothetical protein